MAWKKNKTFNLEGLNQEQYLKLSKKAIQKLKWDITSISPNSIEARITHFLDPWGEMFTILIENNTVIVKSECATTGVLFDLGRNQKNIKTFTVEFDNIKSEYDLDALEKEPYKDRITYDQSKLLDFANDVYDKQNLALGIFGGLLAGIIGLFVWFIFAGVIEDGGYLWAMGIPFLVGYGVRILGKGMTINFKIVGGFLSLFFCIAGRFISLCYLHIEGHEIMTPSLLKEMTFDGFFDIMKAYFLSSDIIYYIYAFAMGFGVSKRTITRKERSQLIEK